MFQDVQPYVAWIDGESMNGYDKNTGRTDAEAIGNLIINLSYLIDAPIRIKDVVLEDSY